jgi:hypothetical protein
LIFEALHNGIDFGSVRGFSAHGITILTLASHLSVDNFFESHPLLMPMRNIADRDSNRMPVDC